MSQVRAGGTTRSNIKQMAKRMQFSVVGLPHYTIWHLYEPSVDDIRHMEVCYLCSYSNHSANVV